MLKVTDLSSIRQRVDDLHFEQGPKLLSTTSFSLSHKTIRFGAEYNFCPFFRIAVSAASDDAGLPAESGGTPCPPIICSPF